MSAKTLGGIVLLILAGTAVVAGQASSAAGGSAGTGGSAGAADSAGAGAPAEPWFFLGPRVAVAGEVAQPADFNAEIQRFYPSASTYFPVYSQIGLEIAERLSAMGSGYRLSFREQLLISGLDQNFALPVARVLLGVLTPFGLEAAIGPQLELVYSGSALGVAPSLVYSVGWRFSLGSISVPVFAVAEPLPPDRKARISVMAGVDYGFAPARPAKPQTPFNY